MVQQERLGVCGFRAGRAPTLSLACGGVGAADAAACGNAPVASDPGARRAPPKQLAPKSRVKAGWPQAPRASAHVCQGTCRMLLELSDTSGPHAVSFPKAGSHFTTPANTLTPTR